MQKEIFRKVSLDRLSSPEQLDLLLDVTTPKGWLALVALCSVVAAGIIWSVTGRSNTTVAGRGVIIRQGGVFSVVSMAGGQVTAISVKVGDRIEANQIVARIAQPALIEKLRSAKEQLAIAGNARTRLQTARTEGDVARLAAINKQIANYEQEILDTQDQIKLAKEQIPVDEQLVAKGLITKQTAIGNRQKVVGLEANVAKLRAQIAQMQSEQIAIRNQTSQVDLENANRVEDLNRNLRTIQQDLSLSSNVVSPNAGRVVELKVYPGAMVAGGTPIISIEPTVKTLEAVVYVSSAAAKEIQPGMDVHISPSGVQREEYGYMNGKVRYVADFPATSEAIVRNFENEALARSMLSEGPVTELRVLFLEDPATVSGFKWSSSKGPPAAISSGAVCTVEVVTREQRPFELVFPYVKRKLGLV
jgi:HlyD family secretion protein